MISPNRIRYAGIFSNELNIPDLITCVAMDSDNGEVSAYLNREAVASESHDGRYKRIHSFRYTETFAPKFTFIKSNFGDFTMEEVRVVLKWLTSKDTTALLETYYDDSNVVSWASIGGFVEPQTHKLANNRTVAITATWDSISPFALSDLYNHTKTISAATDNKLTINIDTDDNKPVYPRVTIQHNGSVVNIPTGTTYSSLVDMIDKIENTAYFNGTTYFWKATEPVWRSNTVRPGYAGWTVVEVDRAYTASDTFATNAIYYYAGDGMYYWKTSDGAFYSSVTLPTYADWVTVEVNRVYTKDDDYANKTFYYYAGGGMYYWIDPYSFHTAPASEPPNLATTSVRITNRHYNFFNQPSTPVITIVKNNTSTEKIVLDGANKIVSSNSTRRIFGDDFNLVWLPLYDGKNEITVEGNCTVTIEYREARKCGEY